MKTVTQWFKGSKKPVHVGVYQNGSPSVYQYWNGKHWCSSCYSLEAAASEDSKNYKSLFQHDAWRGLAVKPKSGIKTRSPKAK